MKNAYYQPGERRAENVHKLFEKIAPRYDLANDIQSFGLHRYWKRRVVELARLGPNDRALDVCCGTGDIAERLSRSGARVTGLDFSARMLEVARSRARSAGVQVEYVQGDAQALPFGERSYDAVTIGYGLRNLPDWRVGLSEMVRVTKQGGRVIVLDFGKPPNSLWRAVYFSYLRVFVPVIGKIFAGDSQAYSYILHSLKVYPAQEGVRDQMISMGLKEVGVVAFMGGVMTINHGVV